MQNLIKRNSGPNRRSGMEGKTLAEKLAQNEAAQEAVYADAARVAEVPAQADDRLPEPAFPVKPAGFEPAAADTTETDAVVAAAKAMRERYAGGPAPSSAAKTCLIVDDSRVIRKVSSKIAISLGYVPIEAENGEEALARCKKSMPDLVLTDWNMPEMDGIEFVAKLRSIPTPKEPVVVFCTSNGEAKDIHDGIAAGADDYIVKPFDEAALKAKLEKLGRG
ncbi:response regulator [Porphyrobacter sp. AAP60]|uniref:response regulator n=1 Tax=Porphyrobacter sp. AAP60 TaxID=1523423 RepID=UPI000AFC7AAE|nr:response regulator [Porphyrobacter sp. AAP60]